MEEFLWVLIQLTTIFLAGPTWPCCIMLSARSRVSSWMGCVVGAVVRCQPPPDCSSQEGTLAPAKDEISPIMVTNNTPRMAGLYRRQRHWPWWARSDSASGAFVAKGHHSLKSA